MIFKKSGGQIYDVELTAKERKALNEVAGRNLAEWTRNHDLEIEAIIIRQLRRLTGWGETRLKRFYEGFDVELNALIERYEMGGSDAPWLCIQELKSEGIDIEQWHRDKCPNEKYEVKNK